MNYALIYHKLMERAQTREDCFDYTEWHHVVPRSEGGSNKKANKVELTPKEHHLAHLVLIRLGLCPRYCFRHITIKEYIKLKERERRKKHLL